MEKKRLYKEENKCKKIIEKKIIRERALYEGDII